MPTGMQTGARRTGSAPLRTGSAPAPTGAGPGGGGGGPLKGIMDKWNAIEPKKRLLIIACVSIFFIAIIALNVNAAANKPVPLFNTNMDPRDVQEVQQRLTAWNIPYKVEEGGINIAVPPQYKHRALMRLAEEGLPKRSVTTSSTVLGGKGGMVPDTKEDKDRKMQLALEGDLVMSIREIEGIADAYVKIVPRPESGFGEEKGSASASILLKMYPNTKLSKKQILGIVNLVSSSVRDLDPASIKIVDTTGKLLNDPIAMNSAGSGDVEGSGEYTTPENELRRTIEKDMTNKVRQSLTKILGTDNYEVALTVEMDNSQTETQITKHGGPTNTEGSIVSKKTEDIEEYSAGGTTSGSGEGINPLSAATGGSDKSVYKKGKVTIVNLVDKRVTRKIDLTPEIKRVSCSVVVDGIKDPEMITKVQHFVEGAINYNDSRGDYISVTNFPINREEWVKQSESQPAMMLPDRRNSSVPSWLPMAIGIPFVVLAMIIALFYMKQKSVEKEKQRLVLSSGPGATVSDISDLLADKEGKITPPAPTKVNTTDQLENLAKEKPTKVAELLKSTWLADR